MPCAYAYSSASRVAESLGPVPSDPIIRLAARDDIAAIVRLLNDDELGQGREDSDSPPNEKYQTAFAAIDEDPNNDLVVIEQDGVCVGCLQITIFPGFDRLGARRGWIEGVRVASYLVPCEKSECH